MTTRAKESKKHFSAQNEPAGKLAVFGTRNGLKEASALATSSAVGRCTPALGGNSASLVLYRAMWKSDDLPGPGGISCASSPCRICQARSASRSFAVRQKLRVPGLWQGLALKTFEPP